MQFEFVLAVQRCEQAKGVKAALAIAQRGSPPPLPPAIPGEEPQPIAVEVRGACQGSVDVVLADHFAPVCQPGFVARRVVHVHVRLVASWEAPGLNSGPFISSQASTSIVSMSMSVMGG